MAYTTTALVKTYLGISGTGDDALLTTLCAAAQRLIEVRTERVFEAPTNTSRALDAVVDVDGDTLLLPYDLCAITSVTNGDSAVLLSTDYVTEPRVYTPWYALRLKASKGLSWTYTTDPEDAIVIVGRWAYSLTPPADIGQAAMRLAGWLYRAKDAQVYDITAQPDMGVITVPQGFPKDVDQILRPYRRTR
jgi:hypothetical protein